MIWMHVEIKERGMSRSLRVEDVTVSEGAARTQFLGSIGRMMDALVADRDMRVNETGVESKTDFSVEYCIRIFSGPVR